jgi:hypothetical protein
MTAAIIGLIGVVVGALLGGLTNAWVERRKRSAQAEAAGRIIAGDFEIAEKQLGSAIEEDGTTVWWLGDLPTEGWKTNVKDLALAAPPNILRNVTRAYGILESHNLDLRAAKGQGGPDADELAISKGSITDTRVELESRLDSGSLRTPTRTTKAMLIAVVVFLGLLVAGASLLGAVINSHPDVNATSVAAALENRLGPNALADCDPSGGDWKCTVYRLAGPRSTCALTAAALRTSAARSRALASAKPPARDCRETAQQRINVTRDSGQLFASKPLSGRREAGKRARAALAGAIGPLPARSPIDRAWDWLFG